jgi:hypothetical protein
VQPPAYYEETTKRQVDSVAGSSATGPAPGERLLRRQSAEDDRIRALCNRLGPDEIEEVISALAWVSLDLAPTTIASDEDGTRLAASAAANEYLFGFVHYSN